MWKIAVLQKLLLRSDFGGRRHSASCLDSTYRCCSFCHLDFVKQTAIRLRDEFDLDVPKTVDELCSLPRVSPKI
ncbi:hypothetical protein EDD85DRAFT_856242, partial [Armillaria nabsnona]